MSGKNIPLLSRHAAAAATQFDIRGSIRAIESYGTGHIHDTFRVRTRGPENPDYILQRINTRIFKKVPEMMENICRVTAHIKEKLARMPGSDPDCEVLTVISTLEGHPYFIDERNDCWRTYLFIDHSKPGHVVRRPEQAREAGRLYGRFMGLLTDLPGPPLEETIPGFHDAEKRLQAFREAAAADPCRRASGAEKEIAFVRERAPEMSRLLRLGREGRLPLRITHNDTKFNNILFDGSGRGLCVVDLDTVMPGFAATDFGDAIRSAANTAAEDESNLETVGLDLRLFDAFTRGFLGELRKTLVRAEINELAFGTKLMVFLIGLRFLTDHLGGDGYFKTAYPDHNLQRARVQFRLLQSMENQFAAMEDIVRRLARTGNETLE